MTAVNIVLITGCTVIGVKLLESDAEPLLYASAVTPFFHLVEKYLLFQQYAMI